MQTYIAANTVHTLFQWEEIQVILVHINPAATKTWQVHTQIFPLIIGLCAPIDENWDTTKVKLKHTEDADLN